MEKKLTIKHTLLPFVLIISCLGVGCGQKGELFIPDSAVQQPK
jgi:predicted small lipoprotein YifL